MCVRGKGECKLLKKKMVVKVEEKRKDKSTVVKKCIYMFMLVW